MTLIWRSELVALRMNDLEVRKDSTLRVLIRSAKNDPFGEGRLAFTPARKAALITDRLGWRAQTSRRCFAPSITARRSTGHFGLTR